MRYSTEIVKGLFIISAALTPVKESLAVFDQFTPYVYSEVLYDSNYFRTSSNAESDEVVHLGAGLTADLKLSRQHVLLDVAFDQAKHSTFDEYDYIQVNAKGTWDWQVGNRWGGKLGHRYTRKSSSFENRVFSSSGEEVFQLKDIRSTHANFFEASYQALPDWVLKGALYYENASYQQQKHLERDRKSHQFEMLYQNTLNTQIGWGVTYTTHDLPDRTNDYGEREINGLFYWEGSGKSAFSVNLGFTDVNYKDRDERDYSGTTGRLTYHWALTGKTHLDISIWQETSSLDAEVESYVLTSGISILPTWSVSGKVTVFGELTKTDDDLETPGEEGRDYDTLLYRIGASWVPLDYLQMSFSYGGDERNSSISSLEYGSEQIYARVQLTF